ncbi:MAG: hypothetical protein IH940_09875 [Acidobacteria bacterium]|nr:hypothetical protein [Acidobacteriota bacterium]
MTDDSTLESESTEEAQPEKAQGKHARDVFELLATILLALAAVSTAWAGFESAKWGGVQATNFSQAGAARTESVRASTLAGQQATIDVTTFFAWLGAVVDEADRGVIESPSSAAEYEPTPETLSGFTFTRFRGEFGPAVEAWLALNPFGDDSAPPTPFAMEEYELEAQVESDRLQSAADQKASDAGDANQTSDNYVLTAVLFATALFFAAISTQLVRPLYRTATLAVGALMFLGTTSYILSLPIEI